MEEQLEAEGVTLFPDSFVHSTLGGWVATRSAGRVQLQQIEDMVIALRMVTPAAQS